MAWYHPELLSPRADLLGHVREPAVAAEPRDAARRVGVPRAPDPEQPAEADSHLDGSRRSRSAQPERDARQHARLGRRQREHGAECWRPRAITTSSSSPATPATATAPSSSRRCRKRSSGCGRGIAPARDSKTERWPRGSKSYKGSRLFRFQGYKAWFTFFGFTSNRTIQPDNLESDL